jgi:hypothetical protein
MDRRASGELAARIAERLARIAERLARPSILLGSY